MKEFLYLHESRATFVQLLALTDEGQQLVGAAARSQQPHPVGSIVVVLCVGAGTVGEVCVCGRWMVLVLTKEVK